MLFRNLPKKLSGSYTTNSYKQNVNNFCFVLFDFAQYFHMNCYEEIVLIFVTKIIEFFVISAVLFHSTTLLADR